MLYSYARVELKMWWNAYSSRTRLKAEDVMLYSYARAKLKMLWNAYSSRTRLKA